MAKLVKCEYPGYFEMMPTALDRFLDRVAGRRPSFFLRPRYIFISAMLLSSFLQFGAAGYKAMAVAIAAYVLMVLPLGTRHIERVALILFAISAAAWLEIVPERVSASIGRHASALVTQLP